MMGVFGRSKIVATALAYDAALTLQHPSARSNISKTDQKELQAKVKATADRLGPWAAKLNELLSAEAGLQPIAQSGASGIHEKYGAVPKEKVEQRVFESLPGAGGISGINATVSKQTVDGLTDLLRAFPMIKGSIGRIFLKQVRTTGVSASAVKNELGKYNEILDALPSIKMVGPETFRKLANLEPVRLALSAVMADMSDVPDLNSRTFREPIQDAFDSPGFRKQLQGLPEEVRNSVVKLASLFEVQTDNPVGTTRIQRAQAAIADLESKVEALDVALEKTSEFHAEVLALEGTSATTPEQALLKRELAAFSEAIDRSVKRTGIEPPSRDQIVLAYATQKVAGPAHSALDSKLKSCMDGEFGMVHGSKQYKEAHATFTKMFAKAYPGRLYPGLGLREVRALPLLRQIDVAPIVDKKLQSDIDSLQAICAMMPGGAIDITTAPSGVGGTYNVPGLPAIATSDWDGVEQKQNAATPEGAVAKAAEQYRAAQNSNNWLVLGSEQTGDFEINVGLAWAPAGWRRFEEHDGQRASHIGQ